jgi:hypothetical protein
MGITLCDLLAIRRKEPWVVSQALVSPRHHEAAGAANEHKVFHASDFDGEYDFANNLDIRHCKGKTSEC